MSFSHRKSLQEHSAKRLSPGLSACDKLPAADPENGLLGSLVPFVGLSVSWKIGNLFLSCSVHLSGFELFSTAYIIKPVHSFI